MAAARLPVNRRHALRNSTEPELVYAPKPKSHQKLKKNFLKIIDRKSLTQEGGPGAETATENHRRTLELLQASLLADAMVVGITSGRVSIAPIQLIGSLPFFLAIQTRAGSWFFHLRTRTKAGTTKFALMHWVRQHGESTSREIQS